MGGGEGEDGGWGQNYLNRKKVGRGRGGGWVGGGSIALIYYTAE